MPLNGEYNHETVYHDSDCGPVFGSDDLFIHDDCNVYNSIANLGRSYTCPYKYGSKEAKEYLCGSNYFIVTNYEIYQVNFS